MRMFLKNLWIQFLQKITKQKEKNVHTEAYYRDDLWQVLKKHFGKGYTWFIITPANYEYCKVYFNLKLKKDEFKKKITERVTELKEKGENIQLHIHLCNKKEFLDKALQDNKFNEAMEFLNSLDIKPAKFAPGWYTYDDYTISLVKKHGMQYLYDFDHNPRKKSYVKNDITIIYDFRVYHDYDFRKKKN